MKTISTLILSLFIGLYGQLNAQENYEGTLDIDIIFKRGVRVYAVLEERYGIPEDDDCSLVLDHVGDFNYWENGLCKLRVTYPRERFIVCTNKDVYQLYISPPIKRKKVRATDPFIGKDRSIQFEYRDTEINVVGDSIKIVDLDYEKKYGKVLELNGEKLFLESR